MSYGTITIEIPASCRECQLFVQGVHPYYCAGDTSYDHAYEHGDWLVNNYAATRPDWCPIHPISKKNSIKRNPDEMRLHMIIGGLRERGATKYEIEAEIEFRKKSLTVDEPKCFGYLTEELEDALKHWNEF